MRNADGTINEGEASPSDGAGALCAGAVHYQSDAGARASSRHPTRGIGIYGRQRGADQSGRHPAHQGRQPTKGARTRFQPGDAAHGALCRRASHTFPGAVRSNIGRKTSGLAMMVAVSVFQLIGPLVFIPDEESGDRHLYLATSAKLPAKEDTAAEAGVDGKGVMIRGLDGSEASGLYVMDEKCEPASPKVEELIRKFRTDGTLDTIWADVEKQFTRITGKVVG